MALRHRLGDEGRGDMGYLKAKQHPELMAMPKRPSKMSFRRSAWTPTVVLVLIALITLLVVYALRELMTGVPSL